MKESQFAKDLAKIANAFGAQYVDIPDLIPTQGAGKYTAHKRPFDCILSTQNANICLELKIDYRPLKEHQKEYLFRIYQRNGYAFVLRAIELKAGRKYRLDRVIREGLEYGKEVVLETRDIREVMEFIIDLS